MTLSRRRFLACAAAVPAAALMPEVVHAGTAIHVHKGRGCGCCTAWVEILKAEGFTVTDDTLHPGELVKLKLKKGVPEALMSCHTAEVDGYLIEGHVPPADIRRLLAEKPNALGLAVPDMPYGSPGMGPEDQREAYDVILFRKDGTSEVFTSYDAAT